VPPSPAMALLPAGAALQTVAPLHRARRRPKRPPCHGGRRPWGAAALAAAAVATGASVAAWTLRPWDETAVAGPALVVPAVLASPATLFVARDGDNAAISLAGESGCAETPAELAEDLAIWLQRSEGARARGRAYRTLAFPHVRRRLLGLWDERRLLVSCYATFQWLRSGMRPESGEPAPPDANEIQRGLQRVNERPNKDATDEELRSWLSSTYAGPRARRLLAASAALSEKAVLSELRAFFVWFREHFPYYRGACGSCGLEGRFLGLARPPLEEQLNGSASVAEVYICSSCNDTTRFPRFRTAPPVLVSQRGRCGEYSWLSLRLLEALGFPARWVDNHAGHVWVEACVLGRWVHVDPCEAAVDQPLLYAEQWGRCPEHVLAYRPTPGLRAGAGPPPGAVVDVTENYRPASAGQVAEETQRAVAKALAEAQAREAANALHIAEAVTAAASSPPRPPGV